jgi:hypothetical protein
MSGRFIVEERGARDSKRHPLPLAHPHPGLKSGTFYFAEKGKFLLCLDMKAMELALSQSVAVETCDRPRQFKRARLVD